MRPGRPVQLDTACDAPSSYAMAEVVPVNNATEAASFTKGVVIPGMETAGWKLWRVLTDGGSEFKAEFDQACRNLSVKRTRTKYVMRGPTDSSSDCRERSFTNTGGLPSGGAASAGAFSDKHRWTVSCSSTPSGARTRATVPKDEHLQRSFCGAVRENPHKEV